jgi:hypothetical protein
MSKRTEEIESMAWGLIDGAKSAPDRVRRRLLLRHAFELGQRAALAREAEMWESAHPPALADYQLCLGDADGATLWIDLHIEGRVDAIWAAYALAIACSEEYDEFNLWSGKDRIAGASIPWTLPETAGQIAEATERLVLERLELLQQSHARLAHSRKLADEIALLRSRLARHDPK